MATPELVQQSADANRRGFSIGHVFRNFNPPSRLHAPPRPGGRHSLDVRQNIMRLLITAICGLFCSLSASADEISFSKVVKASLVFRDDFDAKRHYPHVLKVFLCLDNAHDSNISWVANSKIGIEAELFDSAGNPVQQGPQAASIQSNACAYLLPYGSRLDWLISHRGISLAGDAKDKYAVIVGSRGWLIPIETASTYTLRIRLRGLPWTDNLGHVDLSQSKLLLNLPPTNIQVTK